MSIESRPLHRELSVTAYVIVLIVLALLTVLTVGVSFLALSPAGHLAIGLTIATLKASLVLLFFMHVINSSPHTRVIIGAALLWLAILFSLTLTDYLTRGLIPRMPGH